MTIDLSIGREVVCETENVKPVEPHQLIETGRPTRFTVHSTPPQDLERWQRGSQAAVTVGCPRAPMSFADSVRACATTWSML
jgi:hypothetical protein